MTGFEIWPPLTFISLAYFEDRNFVGLERNRHALDAQALGKPFA